jgi:hypothetical protein
VEHIVFPGTVLDPCGYHDGITVGGMALSLSQFHIDSAYLFAQALSFKNINGESIFGTPELTLIGVHG